MDILFMLQLAVLGHADAEVIREILLGIIPQLAQLPDIGADMGMLILFAGVHDVEIGDTGAKVKKLAQ